MTDVASFLDHSLGIEGTSEVEERESLSRAVKKKENERTDEKVQKRRSRIKRFETNGDSVYSWQSVNAISVDFRKPHHRDCISIFLAWHLGGVSPDVPCPFLTFPLESAISRFYNTDF